jgi:hypothetical protein
MQSAKQRFDAALRARFPNNNVALIHFGDLLTEYADSGVAPPHLVAEVETADENKLWSYIWEAMLYRHLRSGGCQVRGSSTPSRQHGPDFCIDVGGLVVWIEATVPAPEGIPADYLAPPRAGEFRVKTKPDSERVLRCSSVIADKQRKFSEYRAKGLIGPDDCTVIAVNICRLSDFDIDGNGISQYPLAMEAVFPIGPIAVPILVDGAMGPAQIVPRYRLKKASGVDISGALFLNPAFANVSAVTQCYQRDIRDGLFLASIHNPLAASPLPHGALHPCKEFVADQEGDSYTIRDVAKSGSLG